MSAIPDLSSFSTPYSGVSSGRSPQLRRFSVDQYDLMIKNGILGEDDRVELINGAIIEKMPKGTLHSAATDRISRLFYRTFGEDVIIRNQNPIRLDEFSEPEPDIVLVSATDDGYSTKHPVADEILLIIEVADSSLYFDRETKGEAYARAGIVQFIIVNLQKWCVEDFRDPSEGQYKESRICDVGEMIEIASFPGVRLSVDDLLPLERP